MEEQLCISHVKQGEHDSMISFLIRNGIKDKTILHEMMVLTKGHENPKIIQSRIDYLREQADGQATIP